MKVIKGRYDLVYFFLLPFISLSIFLFFYSPIWLSLTYNGHWVFLIFTLICLFHSGKTSLGERGKPHFHNTLRWLLGLFSILLLLNLFFWGITKFVGYDFPVSVPKDLQMNVYKLVGQTGFFPWAFSTLMAIILGYGIYYQKKAPLFSSIFSPCFHNTHVDSVGIAVDSYMRLLCTMCMTFTATFMTLAMLTLLEKVFAFSLDKGFTFPIVLVNTMLIFLVSNRLWNKLIRYLTFHWHPVFILFCFAIFMSLFILVCSFAVFWLVGNISLPVQILFTVDISHFTTYATIMIVFFWIPFAVLAGAVIASISKGRTIRAIIGYSFTLNFISWVIIFLFDYWTKNFMLRGVWVTLICSLLISLLLSKSTLSYLMRASLPTATDIKPRSPHIFVRTILSSATLLISLYLALGVYALGFLGVAMLLPPIFVVGIGATCFVRRSWQ